MKTNSKEFTALMSNYILNAISSDSYEVEANTDQEKLQFLADCFSSEYLFRDNLKRFGSIQNCLKEWLMGLPSSFNVEYRNHAILEIAEKWGSIPSNATEKQKDTILSNWFNLVAFKTLQLMAKNGIHPVVKN